MSLRRSRVVCPSATIAVSKTSQFLSGQQKQDPRCISQGYRPARPTSRPSQMPPSTGGTAVRFLDPVAVTASYVLRRKWELASAARRVSTIAWCLHLTHAGTLALRCARGAMPPLKLCTPRQDLAGEHVSGLLSDLMAASLHGTTRSQTCDTACATGGPSGAGSAAADAANSEGALPWSHDQPPKCAATRTHLASGCRRGREMPCDIYLSSWLHEGTSLVLPLSGCADRAPPAVATHAARVQASTA